MMNLRVKSTPGVGQRQEGQTKKLRSNPADLQASRTQGCGGAFKMLSTFVHLESRELGCIGV